MTAAPASADPAPAPAGAHPAKRAKKPACKRRRVPLTVNGRKSCRPLGATLPRPQTADPVVVLAQSALDPTLSRFKDRSGRRPPSAQALFGRIGPGAYTAMKAALPRAVALLRQQSASAGRLGAPSLDAHAAATVCGVPADPTRPPPPGFSEKSNGVSLEAKILEDSLSVAIESTQQTGQTKRISIDLDLCQFLENKSLPSCPTHKGVLDALYRLKLKITVALLEDGKVVHSYSAGMDDTTRLHGQVADDAKLDYLDIDDVQKPTEAVGAQSILVGAMSVAGTIQRHTRVDMRTGNYEQTQTHVEISASLGGIAGLLVGGEFRTNAAKRLKDKSDKLFAERVKKAIDDYRARENAWQTPNTCAKLEFNPRSNTVKLKYRDRGHFDGRISAIFDDGDPGGRWSLTHQSSGRFTPASAEGGHPQFSYEVTNPGDNVIVRASFRVTSKAGIAAGEWTQRTGNEVPMYKGQFSGTLQVVRGMAGCHATEKYDYSAGLGDRKDSGRAGQPFPFQGGGAYAESFGEGGSGSIVYETSCANGGCSATMHLHPPPPGHVTFDWRGGSTVVVEVFSSGYIDDGGCDNGQPYSYAEVMVGHGELPLDSIGDKAITVSIGRDDSLPEGHYTGSGSVTLQRVN